ncbi:MAG TPA: hypothetical protein VFQ85_03795 [Mycobacteriales bacterium]|jgi:hypothetical protein|nr:hypothetical protein [Mycobacteriales bacterium]
MRRTLCLKREALAELGTADLVGIGGAGGATGFSCLDYVSCYPWDCLPQTLVCVEGAR